MEEARVGRVGGYSGCGSGGRGTKCGRWNPTTEQVKLLTDLFRSGLRTPTADQIQTISSQLSFYGKIESKNVFYWFQNHKARERQKRRRKVLVDDDSKHEAIQIQQYQEKDRSHISSTKHQVAVGSSERMVETLQLFPLNAVDESEGENFRFSGDSGAVPYSNTTGAQKNNPMLDLRLSIL